VQHLERLQAGHTQHIHKHKHTHGAERKN
jgi:hypothetical protein